MFDVIAGTYAGAVRHRSGPLAISLLAHIGVFAAVAIPALLIVGAPPQLPTMMAFVVAADVVPPPPPPPPPALPARPADVKPVAASPDAAPIEAPATIAPESGFEQSEAGVDGGVEGGIPGGVVGGIVGGIEAAAPPPPPPPVPARRTPVRVGGQVSEPRVLTRVPPVYPEIAARAMIHGVVILEATVDEEGAVQNIKVLRSVKFLDEAAIEALKQWRYEPLTLNGTPQPFVLTVSLVFSVETASGR
jgi:protein TonB